MQKLADKSGERRIAAERMEVFERGTGMQAKEAVVFRGDRRGLSLHIDQEAPFGAVVDELRHKLASAADFFQGAEVRIDAGRRATDEVETRLLHELIRAHGMMLSEGGTDGRTLDAVGRGSSGTTPIGGDAMRIGGDVMRIGGDAMRIGGDVMRIGGDAMRIGGDAMRTGSGAVRTGRVAENRPGSAARRDAPAAACLLVERTLRSGQRVEFDGSIVVLGDVNPGADVVATGSIIVVGTLRGMVHAGAGGDVGARVVALRLHPTQLRIAHHISRPPDDELPQASGPEVALISGEHIEIERYES